MMKAHDELIALNKKQLNEIFEQLKKAREDSDVDRYNFLKHQFNDIASFLENYIEQLVGKKENIQKEIDYANSVLENDVTPVSSYIANISFDEKECFSDMSTDLKGKQDVINEITLKIFHANTKAKGVIDSINLSVQDTESFIENKKASFNKMIEKDFSNKSGVSDSSPLSGNSFNEESGEIKLSSEQFVNFVNYVNKLNGDIISLQGSVGDDEYFYMNDKGKIRPPVDVIEKNNLPVTIKSGSVYFIDSNGMKSIKRVFKDSRKASYQNELTKNEIFKLIEAFDDCEYNITFLEGYLPNKDEFLFKDGVQVIESLEDFADNDVVTITFGQVIKHGINYDFNHVLNSFKREIKGGEVSEDKEPSNKESYNIIDAFMDADTIPQVKDKKFFQNMNITPDIFMEIVGKIEKNNFKFCSISAKAIADNGEHRIHLIGTNISPESKSFIKLSAKKINIESAIIRTDGNDVVSLMEALILLD